MPNIGLPELVIVLVIALVVFGPKRLPEMGQKLGQALREFRSATSEIRSQVGVDDIADSIKDVKSSLSLTSDSPRSNAETVAGATAAGALAGSDADSGPTGTAGDELASASTDLAGDAALPTDAESIADPAAAADAEPIADPDAAADAEPIADSAAADVPATESLVGEPPQTDLAAPDAPALDQPGAEQPGGNAEPLAITDDGDGGVEAFGSLKRGAASAPAADGGEGGDSGVEAFGSLKRGAASAPGRATIG